jgi:hypothetical protein
MATHTMPKRSCITKTPDYSKPLVGTCRSCRQGSQTTQQLKPCHTSHGQVHTASQTLPHG